MESREFAIVDIETTGGSAGNSRITEIAINIFDGNRIVDRFCSLVNPQREIPFYITTLTGISNEMVSNAPLFSDIAPKVFEMLSGRVFVAHNVNFDYSFVRNELEASGIKWTARKLCTVRAARKVRPGLKSYSLGNLCRTLEIPQLVRHRAGSDADATTILLGRLLQWDINREIDKMLGRNAKDQRLPPNLPPSDFESLPQAPGVYYFHNQHGKVIYVGKAVNLKKRVSSHFSGHNIKPQRQNFLREIHRITYETCATELMALLLECSEIRRLWPEYNRALKRFEAKFGLFCYEARNGYKYLAVGKLAKHQSAVTTFYSEYEGVTTLRNLAERFEIDYRFCCFGRPDGTWPQTGSPECEPASHNDKVQEALEFLTGNRPSFALLDEGRTSGERSCIWVEKGELSAMGYVAETEVDGYDKLKEQLTPYRSNQYVMQLVNSFAEKYPQKVLFLS